MLFSFRPGDDACRRRFRGLISKRPLKLFLRYAGKPLPVRRLLFRDAEIAERRGIGRNLVGSSD